MISVKRDVGVRDNERDFLLLIRYARCQKLLYPGPLIVINMLCRWVVWLDRTVSSQARLDMGKLLFWKRYRLSLVRDGKLLVVKMDGMCGCMDDKDA